MKRKQDYEALFPWEDDLFPAPWLAGSELMCVQLILTHSVVSSYGIAARIHSVNLREAAKKWFFSGPANKKGGKGRATEKKELCLKLIFNFKKIPLSSRGEGKALVAGRL